MARANPDPLESSLDIAPDALNLLRRDHRLVEELFAEFRRAAPQQLDPLARRICKMLRVHAQIEEEMFYPVVRRALTDAAPVDEAEHAHATATGLIARVESSTAEQAEFTTTVEELAAHVTQHIEQEERLLFEPLTRAAVDLVALGIALAERRDTLLDVLGLHGDDEEGAANQRETHTATAVQRAQAARREH